MQKFNEVVLSPYLFFFANKYSLVYQFIFARIFSHASISVIEFLNMLRVCVFPYVRGDARTLLFVKG